MGSPIFADDHTYEVIREYSHRARRTKIDILRELAAPLEERLEREFGVRIVEDQVVQVESQESSSSAVRSDGGKTNTRKPKVAK